MDKLNFLNFSYYAFHCNSPRLSPQDQKKALCLSIAMGVFLGLGHLIAKIVYKINHNKLENHFKKIDLQQAQERFVDQTAHIGSKLLLSKSAAIPSYAKPFCDDPTISNRCKELFKQIFVDIINLENLSKVQPLGQLVGTNGAITHTLHEFNNDHFGKDTYNYLGCRGSHHSSDKNDPWQTIKITAPSIKEVGKTSPLLLELKKNLDKHYHLKSGGGANWMQWTALSFQDKMKKDKYDPICFEEQGVIMTPQLMLTLIDLKKILGVIQTDEDYIKALEQAYGYTDNDSKKQSL